MTGRLLWLLVLLVPSVAGAQRLIHAGANWAALERGPGRCEAVGRSELVVPKGGIQPRAAFAFSRDGRRRGELHLILSRPARPGADALLQVGDASFLLFTRGRSAWSRGAAQERAILAAIRQATEMRVRAQGVGGRVSDRYLLAGAPTAIDAAALGCA
ncbi:hypothetical protein GCM10022280_02070 [Sphingomonas swuensis]|uniref:Uncharacterized protein n=1 Tax=Sphingomonas swuensis TaxID=977800 RepID=A0ABP7S9V3_9SPHN